MTNGMNEQTKPSVSAKGAIKGTQGTIGTNVVQHLMKEFMGDAHINKNSRMEDPREALLKYAEVASKEKKYITGYEQTQPEEIFRQEEDEPDEKGLPSKKKKKPFPFY